jgi:multiple sugar transport system ATP-binding protein
MASLKLEKINKIYEKKVHAVKDFSMEIKDKEFIVFVGPSGCGKSTILRMIAGLEEITSGKLFIGSNMVNDVEPKDRDIAMVFQNYALYPHMNVYENMAFGLKLRKTPKEEIHDKVMSAAKILGITDLLDRKPRAMSGGQRQRVALGRAIVRDPKVFLLDEPLSNLDAKLRTQMRTEIIRLHQKLETTFIYVTHDQVEAMTMGTRIVVLKDGIVQQIDTPMNLYNYPANKFVAEFIGTPPMNFFEATIKGDEVELPGFGKISLKTLNIKKEKLNKENKVFLGLRPENIELAKNPSIKNKFYIRIVESLGSETIIYLSLSNTVERIDKEDLLIAKFSESLNLIVGDELDLAFNLDSIHIFDAVTGESILKR